MKISWLFTLALGSCSLTTALISPMRTKISRLLESREVELHKRKKGGGGISFDDDSGGSYDSSDDSADPPECTPTPIIKEDFTVNEHGYGSQSLQGPAR